MNYELYQKKNMYEKFIKNLNDALIKLDNCYSNLILCKNKMNKTLKTNDNYYNYKYYEKIIDDIDKNRNEIKNILLPEAKYEYNKILSEISKL